MTSPQVHLDIAGITFTLDLPDPDWQALLAARYAEFLRPNVGAWRVTLTADPTLTRTNAPWVRHEGQMTTYRVSNQRGWIDLSARQAGVSAPGPAMAGFAADRILTYLCIQVAPREHNSLLLHAAGVIWRDAGLVFTGASGAGKSTIARLAADQAQVLSDENVIVRLGQGAEGPALYSTPFWGMSTPPDQIYRRNLWAPLRAIYLLAHGPEFQVTPLTPAEAIMALLTTEKVAVESAASAQVWLAAASDLAQNIPIYKLTFRPDPALWAFLEHADARTKAPF